MNSKKPVFSQTRGAAAPDGESPPPAARKVERLLAEYLRAWGLRDPAMVAALCGRWASAATGDTQADLARAAVQRAECDVQKWLDHVATLISPGSAEDRVRRRGLIAMTIQDAIDDYPDAFLRYDPLPTGLLRRLQDAARPVVPNGGAGATMPVQPLGELPPVLRPGMWRRTLTRLLAACLLVTRFNDRP